MQSTNNINESNNLAEQSFWNDFYASIKFNTASTDDVIRKWIENNVIVKPEATCIEIGCFPGRYLTVFGDMGYRLSGIDLTPRVDVDFPKWLIEKKYKTDFFEKIDFFHFKPIARYDVVCSFGFIEHFKNWETVIQMHLDLVASGGYIVIETPNFKGLIQRAIHLLLDYENYKRHHIPSMVPHKWKKILEQNNFEIITYGYIGTFDFWVESEPKTFFQKVTYKFFSKMKPLLKKIFGINSLTSPYMGIIGKKIYQQ